MNIDEISDNASLSNHIFNEHDPYSANLFVSDLNEGIMMNHNNVIHNKNNIPNAKNILPNVEPNNTYADNSAQINDENFNVENLFKSIDNDEKNNSKLLKDNKIQDWIQMKSTTCQIDEINGKKIITSNNKCDKIFDELYGTTEMNIPTIKEMQMVKKKRKRRTREEIENDKKNEIPQEQKVKKKRGREKRNILQYNNVNEKHSKNSDDNIIKKINAHFLEEIITWLNKSFLDSSNMNFQDEQRKKKLNDNYFLKLKADLITNHIKRQLILQIMGQKFKDIFSSIPISTKYRKLPKSNNKDLVEKIYKENNQPFVIYILNMTFLEGLNYFSGQISDENIFNYFKGNYNIEIIQKFINNFRKIDNFLGELYKKYNGENNTEETKDYLTKTKVLCLNYKENFEHKYDRRVKVKNDNEAKEN